MTEPTSPHRLCFDRDTRLIGLRVGKVELGQHIHDAFRLLVSGVFGVGVDRVVVMDISTATCPDDGMTVGSQSVQVTGAEVEAAAHTAWDALRNTAGRRLNVDTASLHFDPDDMMFRSGAAECDLFALVEPADLADIRPAPPADPILGQRMFIQDMTLPDLLHGRALRGREAAAAKALLAEGEHLIEDGGFAAIVAADEARLAALWAKLPEPPVPGPSRFDGPVRDWIGDARTLDDGAPRDTGEFAHSLSASRPFILHGSIAPSCALAQWSENTLTVWTHSQGIFPLRVQIARGLGLDPAQVELRHVPSAGSYGHNGADDAAMDAAMIAMQVGGRPVRVAWPRADDMRAAPVGAPMLIRAAADLDESGRITRWHQHVQSGPHGQRPGSGGHVNLLAVLEREPDVRPGDIPELPVSLGGGAARNAIPLYSIPDITTHTQIVQDLPVRTSSLRGLGAQINTIAIEALMDQIAAARGESPFAIRRRHLDDPRAIAVLEALEARCPRSATAEEGIGIAIGRYKNKAAYAGVAMRIALLDVPHPLEVIAVVDAGRIVSPDGTRNQVEGGIMQALSWTLCEAAYLRDGRIDAQSWSDYPVLDWGWVPSLDIHLMEHPDAPPLGVGECMVGPASAAAVNAVTACVGQPITDLPLTREALIAALA
ncbi:molybdopterin cofactor-binding domain-containing protein [Hasllibacter sp. MH4015]|uniref:molybdopterin cofactor-binding domain-containing protein n=1 Tax=Hasllibacter sp. MH4015 TaxID=2854029 RepID=UPI001CD709D2|nr:molybdopterin cofactor-binding domain-containing protein [Hasllibacter sp. MH4015]